MNIRNIDHLTLTVSDRTVYSLVPWSLWPPIIEFDDGRQGVKVGKQKQFQQSDTRISRG